MFPIYKVVKIAPRLSRNAAQKALIVDSDYFSFSQGPALQPDPVLHRWSEHPKHEKRSPRDSPQNTVDFKPKHKHCRYGREEEEVGTKWIEVQVRFLL